MMLVSSMEYSVNDDFSWDDVYRKAYEIGLYDDISYAVKLDDNYEFKRGDVVELMYSSLMKAMNNTSDTPIDRLIDKKVITRSYAEQRNLLLIDEIKTNINSFNLKSENSFELSLNENIESIDEVVFYKDGTLDKTPNIEIVKNTVVVSLVSEIESFTSYKVVLKGIRDSKGNVVELLEEEFDGPSNDGYDASKFEVTAIKTLSDNSIQVYFSNPITDDAKEVLLYKFSRGSGELIDGSYKNLKIELVPNLKNSIYIKFLDMKLNSLNTYDIFVRGDLKSEYGLYLGEGNGTASSFSGREDITESFYIDDAEFIDKKHVSLIYSRAYDVDTALDPLNYKLKENVSGLTLKAEKVYVNSINRDEFEVVVRFPTPKDDKTYTLEVSGIYDVFDSDIISSYKYDINYAIDIEVYPELEYVEVVNRGLIVMTFDSYLSKTSESASISISNGVSISKKLVDPEDSRRLYLYLHDRGFLEEGEEYKITVNSGIRDLYNRSIKSRITETVDGTNESVTYPDIEKIVFIGGYYYIEFTEYIREQDLINVSNYEFEVRNSTAITKYLPSEVLKVDNKSVFIKSDIYYDNMNSYINIKKLYNYGGQALSSNIVKKLSSILK